MERGGRGRGGGRGGRVEWQGIGFGQGWGHFPLHRPGCTPSGVALSPTWPPPSHHTRAHTHSFPALPTLFHRSSQTPSLLFPHSSTTLPSLLPSFAPPLPPRLCALHLHHHVGAVCPGRPPRVVRIQGPLPSGAVGPYPQIHFMICRFTFAPVCGCLKTLQNTLGIVSRVSWNPPQSHLHPPSPRCPPSPLTPSSSRDAADVSMSAGKLSLLKQLIFLRRRPTQTNPTPASPHALPSPPPGCP